jgi:protein-disulfide isomerase
MVKKKESDILFIVSSLVVGLMAMVTTFGLGYVIGNSNLPDAVVPLGNGAMVEIQIDSNDPYLGDENAPVTIVEFSDFECPFCARHYTQSFEKIKTEYIDRGLVKLVFKDLPIEAIHPNAVNAAVIAECAYDQAGNDMYFEVHNRIFENMAAQTDTLAKENVYNWIADIEGINLDEIKTCTEESRTIDRVNKDVVQAGELGINGTPAVFVNGKFFNGAVPYDQIKSTIDAELDQ